MFSVGKHAISWKIRFKLASFQQSNGLLHIFTELKKPVNVKDSIFRREAENFVGHNRAVLALAIDTTGSFVASGDDKGRIIVWNDNLGRLKRWL